MPHASLTGEAENIGTYQALLSGEDVCEYAIASITTVPVEEQGQGIRSLALHGTKSSLTPLDLLLLSLNNMDPVCDLTLSLVKIGFAQPSSDVIITAFSGVEVDLGVLYRMLPLLQLGLCDLESDLVALLHLSSCNLTSVDCLELFEVVSCAELQDELLDEVVRGQVGALWHAVFLPGYHTLCRNSDQVWRGVKANARGTLEAHGHVDVGFVLETPSGELGHEVVGFLECRHAYMSDM